VSASQVIAEQCTGRGADGVVCAAAPLAAQAGAAVLRDGGNAFDAVVAAALAETVLLPSKCGLGGDLIAIAARAGSEVPDALLAIGGAPAGLAAVATSGRWSDTGPHSVGPPGAPGGYLALATLANHPLDRLADAAIRLASRGFPWAAVSHRLTLASLELLRRWNPGGTAYLPGDEPIAAGALVRLPGLAAALESLVERRDEFLAGPVGDEIVATVSAQGGVLTRDDLLAARAEWTGCDEVRVLDRTVWATPAPTHGPTLLAAVRDAAVGDDPATQYRRALVAISAGRDTLADPSGTSIVSAADRDGNCVVVVHSNSYPRYGSGLVVGEYDLVLANRAGRGFDPEPGHPNFPVPGRRPATTLHAWMAATDDGRALLGGTPGGDNQVPWNTQLLQGIFDGEREPGLLVTAPRWEWLPSDDGVRVEDGFDRDHLDRLADAASRVVRVGRWALPCAQQVIARQGAGQAIVGAADPRTVGLALGV
jgi:gamma-glutamyltranspeptidase/glutathione hydrolase